MFRGTPKKVLNVLPRLKSRITSRVLWPVSFKFEIYKYMSNSSLQFQRHQLQGYTIRNKLKIQRMKYEWKNWKRWTNESLQHYHHSYSRNLVCSSIKKMCVLHLFIVGEYISKKTMIEMSCPSMLANNFLYIVKVNIFRESIHMYIRNVFGTRSTSVISI